MTSEAVANTGMARSASQSPAAGTRVVEVPPRRRTTRRPVQPAKRAITAKVHVQGGSAFTPSLVAALLMKPRLPKQRHDRVVTRTHGRKQAVRSPAPPAIWHHAQRRVTNLTKQSPRTAL